MSDRVHQHKAPERLDTRLFAVGRSTVTEPLGRLLVLLALPFIVPLMAMIAFAVRIGSRGPIILSLRKTNAAGQVYREYRFRCVWVDARARQFRHEVSGCSLVQRDVRVTPVGAFLLRTELNTLPQLFNVLKGDVPLSFQRRD